MAADTAATAVTADTPCQRTATEDTVRWIFKIFLEISLKI